MHGAVDLEKVPHLPLWLRGCIDRLPLLEQIGEVAHEITRLLAFADGPTDAHKSQLARAFMKKAKPADGLFPSEHIPTRLAAARARYPNARDDWKDS